MNKGIASLLAFSGMAEMMNSLNDTSKERGYKEHELPPFFVGDKPPTGSKQYWFDSQGNFSTERMERDRIYFKCFAINDKNAKRKFNKYILDTLPF